jgi:hypothetical protein
MEYREGKAGAARATREVACKQNVNFTSSQSGPSAAVGYSSSDQGSSRALESQVVSECTYSVAYP